MSFLKEFEQKDMAVEEGLAWGGITLSYVMQQKGGSCFSVIEYEPYRKNSLMKTLELPSFRRGWAVWNERQHTLQGDKNFLVVFWNPFETQDTPYIENTLGEKVEKENFLHYFGSEVEKICKEFSKVTRTKLLEYEELMDFLSFSLSMEESAVKMPEVPLYMDALLSQDLNFKFKANNIYINGKKIIVVTLSDWSGVWEIFEQVKSIPYRYVRRILFFDERESEIELKKYVGKWCGGRKTMLEEIEKNILSKVNGYSWNGFIFQIEEKNAEEFCFNLESYLKTQEMSYVFEKYNLKDVWWGSLAGIFLANIVPPITGFKSLEEFILHVEESKDNLRENKFKEILSEMAKMKEGEQDIQNGQI